MVTADDVRAALVSLQPLHLDVVDTSGGCGASFEIVIVSTAFDGVALLERHRIVNNALAPIAKDIHAVSMKTWTPAVWEAKKAKGEA